MSGVRGFCESMVQKNRDWSDFVHENVDEILSSNTQPIHNQYRTNTEPMHNQYTTNSEFQYTTNTQPEPIQNQYRTNTEPIRGQYRHNTEPMQNSMKTAPLWAVFAPVFVHFGFGSATEYCLNVFVSVCVCVCGRNLAAGLRCDVINAVTKKKKLIQHLPNHCCCCCCG
jgi:hypothetical protein